MTPRHLLEPARLAGSALLKAQSDERLVDLTRAGNDRAFEAIVDRYKSQLLRYCSKILPDGRAEDAVQQAFLNAYNAVHRDTTPLSLKSWLFGIAHNVSLNVLRQRGSAHEELQAHQITGEAADQAVERSERLREVLTAVAALPPGQRDALVLREIEGRGHDEIARALGVTGGAARQLISRARNGIRAAAASFLPLPLIMRLTDGTAPPPTAARMAELAAAGGGLTVAKVVATAAVGGALVGGAVKAPEIVRSDRGDRGGNVAEAAASDRDGSASTGEVELLAEAGAGRGGRAGAQSGSDGSRGERARDDHGRGRGGDGPGDRRGSGDGSDDHGSGDDGRPEGGDDHGSRGPGSGEHGDDDGPADDRSGPGSGSAPGAVRPEDDHSGPGSGGDRVPAPEDGHSGSGSGPDEPEPSVLPEADDPDPVEPTELPEEERSGKGSGSSGPG